jgi:hypothetical protein
MMNVSEKDEKLMEFLYDEYQEDSVFQKHGKYVGVLIRKFEGKSGIEFGISGVAAMQRLIERGWIETVSVTGKRVGKTHLNTSSRIIPTIAGFQFVEDKREPWIKHQWPKIVTAVTEGITRVIKK